MYVLAPNNQVAQFPYSISELKAAHPNTSWPVQMTPDVLARYDVYPVVVTGAQYDPSTQVATMTGCEYNSEMGRWETTWAVRDKTPEELAAELAQWRSEAAVDPLDGMKAIDQLGLAEPFQAWLDSPERTFIQRAYFDKATTWKRNDPTLIAGAEELGLTPEQLDQIFRSIIDNR
jgi:hypothetical protein